MTLYTIKSDIPEVVVNNSAMARIAVLVFSSALVLTIFIKTLEGMAGTAEANKVLENENSKFRKRMGIDFRVDRERLVVLAQKTKKNYSNDLFTNRSLFRK